MLYTIQLPSREKQIEFNRQRWTEILSNPWFAAWEGRIETNSHGNAIVTPPASGDHSDKQGEFAFLLRSLLGSKSLPECPVSTLSGVKVVDVGWFSAERFAQVRGQKTFEIAPEICVEIVSPSNTEEELLEKKMLYFEAGASEVWICNLDGKVDFYASTQPEKKLEGSLLLPAFPKLVS